MGRLGTNGYSTTTSSRPLFATERSVASPVPNLKWFGRKGGCHRLGLHEDAIPCGLKRPLGRAVLDVYEAAPRRTSFFILNM
jgi:hypothetical protein